MCLGFTWHNTEVWYLQHMSITTPMNSEILINVSLALSQVQGSIKQEASNGSWLKFIYSENATKFCKISTNHMSYLLPVK